MLSFGKELSTRFSCYHKIEFLVSILKACAGDE